MPEELAQQVVKLAWAVEHLAKEVERQGISYSAAVKEVKDSVDDIKGMLEGENGLVIKTALHDERIGFMSKALYGVAGLLTTSIIAAIGTFVWWLFEQALNK